MATTRPLVARSPQLLRSTYRASRRPPLTPAAALALGLAAVVAYAALASGAIALPGEARVQTATAVLALAALAAVLFAPGMRVRASRSGWAGFAALTALTILTGISLAWSIAPDATWAQLNRTLAYVLITGTALAVGSSLPRALERAGLGFLAIASVVALYALAGKAIPGVHLGPLDFDHTAFFSRLRAPLAYWNALALFCVLASPIALTTAADPDRRRELRAAALASCVLLFTTIGLTYSRGGIACVVIALIVLLAAAPERLRTAAMTAAAAIGALPALAVAFARDDLTTDGLPVGARTDDGALFFIAVVLGIAVALILARNADRRSERTRIRIAPRAVAIAAAVIAGIAIAAGAATSDLDSFTSVKYERQSDPARILQTNSGNRWVWWQEAAGAWSDRPVGGWGAGSFGLLHHRYRHNALEVLQPHSVPLQFLAELGVLGAALLLSALALLAAAGAARVVAGVRGERAGLPAGREHRYAAALLAGVAAWLVHMWFDWDWDIPGVALPFFAALGLLAARPLGMAGRPALARERIAGGWRVPALALGAALACAVVISAVLPSLARDRTQSATEAFARNDYAAAVRDADVARRLNPVAVDGILLEARAAGRRGQFKLASGLLTDAVRRQPDNPAVWLGVARLEFARGDVPAMRAAAARMLELDPVAPVGRFFFLFNDLGVRSATATGTPLSP